MDSSKDQLFEDLFALHYQPLIKYGSSLVGYDEQFFHCIEECVQEAFVVAYQSFEYLKTHPNVAGWLRITLENRIKQRMKKERARINRNQSWEDVWFKVDVSEDEIAKLLHDEECKQKVDYALSKLKTKERDLVIQHYFMGKSIREIAALYHTSQSVVKVQLHRIRQKLKRILGNSAFLLTLLFLLSL